MESEREAELFFGASFPIVSHYVQILRTKGIDWGLIGPREADRLWERHILNSVALCDLIPHGAEVIDVGSGAGLLSLPLAIARPDLRVTLLEPLLRRYTFLNETVAELGLGERVTVLRGRAEETKATYDVVTARAVARLEKLLGWCAPLIGRGGQLLALKGESAADEVHAAEQLLARQHLTAEVLVVRATPGSEPTNVIRVRRG